MAQTLPSYSDLGGILADYRAKFVQHFSPTQASLAQEAAQHLRDLDFLEMCIGNLFRRALELQEPGPADVIKMLQEASKTDPDLAKLLADKPDLQVGQTVSGFTLGSSIESAETAEQQDLRLRTESFYSHAHRLLDCLARLPSLKNLKCDPIRMVRNHLIEHPEKNASGILYPTFSFGSMCGPIIKGVRMGKQVQHQDAGLFPNSERLRHDIHSFLCKALAERT